VPQLQAAPLVPGKDVILVNKDSQQPPWKLWWDEARALSHQQKYLGAVERYLAVLEEKPHIEEVKWELCKTYIALENYDQALLLIESLLEAAPERIDYLISAGDVALQQDRAEQAARYFGEALALEPGGPFSDKALDGLISALAAQGKDLLTIPLMEQQYQRGAAGRETITDLARLCRDNGQLQKSGYYFSELVKKYWVVPMVAREAADVFEKTGRLDEAADQWQVYLQSEPDDLGYRKKLADYLYDQGKPQQALPHLLTLIDNGIDRQTYLLAVARIYLFTLGRSDRALYFFEQYRNEFPDGVDVSDEIENLQLILANDLLAIVENDGVWMLWRDLAMVTPDRIGIYRAMATMLEQMGREKENELLEVLQIIHVHEPQDIEVISDIATLLLKKSQPEKCVAFLEQSQLQVQQAPELTLLKADCFKAAGQDLAELQGYLDYLSLNPFDVKIRTQAIALAGRLGLVDKMSDLYRGSDAFYANSPEFRLERDRAYFDGLVMSGLSAAAQDYLTGYKHKNERSSLSVHFTKELATLLSAQGRNYKAEEMLRTYAARHPADFESYLMLAEYSLNRKDLPAAALWFGALERRFPLSSAELSQVQKSHLVYLKLRHEALSGTEAWHRKGLEYLNQSANADNITGQDLDIILLVAGHCYRDGKYDECLQLLQRLRQNFKGVDAFTAMLFLAREYEQSNGSETIEARFSVLSLSEQLALVRLLLDLGKEKEALSFMQMLVQREVESTRLQLMLAETQRAISNHGSALEIFSGLSSVFAQEYYFREQVAQLENRLGRPAALLDLFVLERDAQSETPRILSKFDSMDYPEAQLMWVRALWASDRWQDALDAYRVIIDDLDREMAALSDKISQVEGYDELVSRLPRGLIFSGPDKPEVLDYFMSAQFAAEHLTNEINRITSTFYEHYRWQKIVKREQAARESLAAKRFYQAEINYIALFTEEPDIPVEVYPDLATVYSRLGKLDEQSEVLEKIKEEKIVYPEVRLATEKSERQQQPHLFLDAHYLEEDGRGGYKDISEKYAGIGLKIKPALFQDVGVLAGRSEWGDSGSSTLLKSNTILGSYNIQFNDNLGAGVNLGFEDFDTDGKSFLIYDASVKGTLEKRLDLFATVSQEPVDDTIDSLAAGIYHRDIQLGLSVEYLFGLFFGLDLSFIDYSDFNEGERYHLWSSYRWFGDRTSLDFTYSFESLQNTISNDPDVKESTDQVSGVGTPALPYWSPDSYWKHLLAVAYKLELSPTGKLQSGTGSLTALYGIGYEKGDFLVHEFDIDILLEISPSFLVKGTFSTQLSEDYKDLEAFASLVYRW
jgi:tetratricopeptide (TPR) repeat protein